MNNARIIRFSRFVNLFSEYLIKFSCIRFDAKFWRVSEPKQVSHGHRWNVQTLESARVCFISSALSWTYWSLISLNLNSIIIILDALSKLWYLWWRSWSVENNRRLIRRESHMSYFCNLSVGICLRRSLKIYESSFELRGRRVWRLIGGSFQDYSFRRNARMDFSNSDRTKCRRVEYYRRGTKVNP